MICASFKNHDEIVKFFLKVIGIGVNAKVNMDNIALFCASNKNHYEVVQPHLANTGIDINTTNKRNNTALMKVSSNDIENLL